MTWWMYDLARTLAIIGVLLGVGALVVSSQIAPGLVTTGLAERVVALFWWGCGVCLTLALAAFLTSKAGAR